jgi:hypothetical protein
VLVEEARSEMKGRRSAGETRNRKKCRCLLKRQESEKKRRMPREEVGHWK